MEATLRLIEQVRRALPTKSNYAVSKALEMPQSQLSEVLKGKYGLGPKAQLRIAEILKRDLRDIMVLTEEDKAKTENDREFWGRRSPRISAAIAVTAMAFGAAGLVKDASALMLYKRTVDALPAIHYAKYKCRCR